MLTEPHSALIPKVKDLLNFLLIDDDPEEIEIFRMAMLSFPQVRPRYFLHSGAALQWLTDAVSGPDMVFVDMNMPVMRGNVLIFKLRALPHLTCTPIYLYSTSTAAIDRDEAMTAGATAFLTKPDSMHSLIQILHEVLNPVTTDGIKQ